MQTLIAQALSQSRRLFVCCLDLCNVNGYVFPSFFIPRPQTVGLPFDFIDLLSRLYSSPQACVRASSVLSPLFHPTCGVCQGNPPSLDLFNLLLGLFCSPLSRHICSGSAFFRSNTSSRHLTLNPEPNNLYDRQLTKQKMQNSRMTITHHTQSGERRLTYLECALLCG